MTGQEIKNYRLANNWTQQQLADRIGVKVVTVLRWEKGTSKISNMALDKLKEVLSLPKTCSLCGREL